MTEQVIEFRDPPPAPERGRRPSSFWEEVAGKCRANPGEWAFVGRWNPSQAVNIRRGRLVSFPAGEFETACRNAGDDKRADLYVRFIGEAS